jgi:cytochrome c oxidase assembly protein subunit 15
MTPSTYRRLTLLALVLVATIIVTGSAVRLSESGKGCADWPNCNDTELIAFSNPNQIIEQTNRLFTGLVSIGVILAVLGAIRRRPRRRDLTVLALALVGGVLLQAVIGGIAVLVDLDWKSVATHFLASVVLLAAALVLHHRAGEESGPPYRTIVSRPTFLLGRTVLVLASWVLVAGTLVTAAGPHGGDPDARRLSWAIPTAARLHGISAMVLLAAVIALGALVAKHHEAAGVRKAVEAIIVIGVAQAAIGYVQYFNGIPALLVGFHVAGAVLVFAAAVRIQLAMREPVSVEPTDDLDLGRDVAAAVGSS